MVELAVRIGFSLLIVLGLVWVLGKVLRGRGRGEDLSVVARAQLTRGGSVALVRVADRTLVLGVTDQQVNLLAEAHADGGPQPEREDAGEVTVPALGRGPRPRTGLRRPSGTKAGPGRALPDLRLPPPAGPAGPLTVRCVPPPSLAAVAPATVAAIAQSEPRVLPAECTAGVATVETDDVLAVRPVPPVPWPPKLASPPEPVPYPYSRNRRAARRLLRMLSGPALAGSVLSPQTWRETVEALRDRTVRKP